MSFEEDTLQKIKKEIGEKYSDKSIIENLESYMPEIYDEIVKYLKEKNQSFPYLEALEIYAYAEDYFESETPSKNEIRKAIDNLI